MDQKWLRVDLCKAGVCFPACNYLLESPTVGTPLARCFTSLCKRVLPLPYHVPGRPASLARSLARSLRSFVRLFVRSFVCSLARSLARSPVYLHARSGRRFCSSVPGPGVRRGPEFHRKSLGYIFTSGAIKAVGVRPFLD